MRNLILIGLGLAVSASMFSCKSNHICPSFESAYILDKNIRDQTFSLFDEDTLPREDLIVRKDKYGIIKSVKYRRKRDEMLTVKMETIFPQVDPPDTMLLAEQDLTAEQIEQIMSEGEQPVNHYNVDQIYYMRHFGQYLPMPEEPGTRVQTEEIPLEQPQVKKKKKWQFWKKKDQSVQDDSVNIGFQEEPLQEEENPSKKELKQQQQLEQQRTEEIERSKQPTIIDLDDFEEDRDNATAPSDQGLFNNKSGKKKKAPKAKGEKKIKLGFGKKKKKVDSVEIIEEEQDQ